MFVVEWASITSNKYISLWTLKISRSDFHSVDLIEDICPGQRYIYHHYHHFVAVDVLILLTRT